MGGRSPFTRGWNSYKQRVKNGTKWNIGVLGSPDVNFNMRCYGDPTIGRMKWRGRGTRNITPPLVIHVPSRNLKFFPQKTE